MNNVNSGEPLKCHLHRVFVAASNLQKYQKSPILQSLTYHLRHSHTPILQKSFCQNSVEIWFILIQGMSKSISTDPKMLRFTSQHPIAKVTPNAPRFLGPQDPFSTSAGSKVERAGGSNQVQEARKRMGDLFILQIWSIFFWKSKVWGESVVFPEEQVLESNALCWSFNIWANMSWLVVDLPLWKILLKWDHYSQSIGKYNMFQTTNQMRVSGAGKTHCTSCGTRIIGMWSMTICAWVFRHGQWMCCTNKQWDPDLTSLK